MMIAKFAIYTQIDNQLKITLKRLLWYLGYYVAQSINKNKICDT